MTLFFFVINLATLRKYVGLKFESRPNTLGSLVKVIGKKITWYLLLPVDFIFIVAYVWAVIDQR